MLFRPEDVGATHLYIGVPACGRMSTVRWGINMAAQQYPLSMSYNYATIKGAEAGDARNRLAQYVKDVKAKFLWMVDDDVFPPQYAVQKLMFAMLNKPTVMACAGIVYTKSAVPQPLVFANDGTGAYYNWKKGKAFEVPGFISTGCMLIRAEVFDKLEAPWFKSSEYPNKMTEDVYFCLKVKEAGYKILGHGGVICGHYDFKSKRIVVAPEEEVILESA